MITCKYFGQLGNQLFQTSAAICHALKMNTNYAFPAKTTAPRIWRTYLNHLPVLLPNQATRDYYKETGPEYSPLPESNDLTIEGYWQSEKYWHEHKENLAEILGFNLVRKDFVAVHVRRGDYLKYPDQFPVLPMDYYLRAINVLNENGFNYFKFYSDDINWCKNNFGTLEGHYFFSENKDPLTDMKDMYNATAFIISNSTYSLFPALLRADNPTVIAPAEDRWFGHAAKHLNSKDRMPERFIKM